MNDASIVIGIAGARASIGSSLNEAKAFVDEVRRRRADGVARL